MIFPLTFHVAALTLLSFSSPPRALIPLSRIALVSLSSSARAGAPRPVRRPVTNTAPMNRRIRSPLHVTGNGRTRTARVDRPALPAPPPAPPRGRGEKGLLPPYSALGSAS